MTVIAKNIEDKLFPQSFLSYIVIKVGYRSVLKLQVRVTEQIDGEVVLL